MIKSKIAIIRGDITEQPVDAIVNAANESLLGGGGVDGAIHRAAGPELLEECKLLGGCPTGEARITGAYNLPSKYIIHTVGPIYRRDPIKAIAKLKNCYINSLNLAIEHACRSIAFPNISTGVYGFPKEEAAMIAIKAVMEYLKTDSFLDKVVFVCFDSENHEIYTMLLSD